MGQDNLCLHKDLTGDDLHVPGYVQDNDPGAQGYGKLWVDTNLGTLSYILKIRNATNTGWSPIAQLWGQIQGNVLLQTDLINYIASQIATVNTFLELTDTPSSYSGQTGKAVRVKTDESGLEFYIPVTTVTWSSIIGTQTDVNVGGFTNNVGYQTASQVISAISSALFGYATQSWVSLQGYLIDAPSDGQQYARKNATWSIVSGSGGAWGTITGVIEHQTDLRLALDNKSNVNHTHTLDALSNVGVSSGLSSGQLLTYDSFHHIWYNWTPNFATTSQLQNVINSLSLYATQVWVQAQGYVTGTPWTTVGYLTDAPSDGTIYGRKNGIWSIAGTSIEPVSKSQTNYELANNFNVSYHTGEFQEIAYAYGTQSSVFANNHWYVGTVGANAIVTKFDPEDLNTQTSVSLGGDPDCGKVLYYDGYIYALTGYGNIYKIDANTMAATKVVSNAWSDSPVVYHSMACDGTYLYATQFASPSVVYQYKLSDFSLNQSVTLTGFNSAHATHTDGINIYVSTATSYVIKMPISDLSSITSASLSIGPITCLMSMVGDYLYLGAESANYIVRVKKSDLSYNLIYLYTTTGDYGVLYDGHYLYAFSNVGNNVIRIDPITYEQANLPIPSTYGPPNAISTDGTRMFFGEWAGGAGGYVGRITLPPANYIYFSSLQGAQLFRLDLDNSKVGIPGGLANTLVSLDANKDFYSLATSTYPSLTEISRVKGVTSALQTQLNNKQAKITAGTSSQFLKGDFSLDSNSYLTSLSGAMLLDQTSPQTIINGAPTFTGLLSNGSIQIGTTGTAYNLDMRDTDVTHGITTLANTNTYGLLKEINATKGGLFVDGFSDSPDNPAIELRGFMVSDPDDGVPAVIIDSYSANGTGTKALAAGKTLLSVQNNGSEKIQVLGDGTTKFTKYTTDGFVKFSGSAGTLVVDTNTYLTSVTAHNVLSATHGDSVAGTVVRGDILFGNDTPKWDRLAFPATPTGKLLQATATDVAWSTNPLTIGASASVSGSNTGDQTLSSLGAQAKLNGTGFVKASGTTVSYDNSTYLTSLSGALLETGTVTGATSQIQVLTYGLQTATINGGSAANDSIAIQGTSHATRTTSYLKLQPNGGFVGVGNSTPTCVLDVGGYNTSMFTMRFGAFVFQPYSFNNGFIAENAYYGSGGWTRISTGYSAGFQFYKGQLMVFNTASGSGAFTQRVIFKTDHQNSGTVCLGGDINNIDGNYTGSVLTVWGTGKVGVNTASLTTLASFGVKGNSVIGSNYATVYDAPSNGLLIEGNVGIGLTASTAKLHIGAGTATAGTAPIKLTTGTLTTVAVAGQIEFLTDDYFATISTGNARKAFVLDDGARLTSGRVPIATTNGRLTDDADMTFATDTLTVTKIKSKHYAADGTAPVADGTYTVGLKLTPVTGNDGTITVKDGIITAIQQAT